MVAPGNVWSDVSHTSLQTAPSGKSRWTLTVFIHMILDVEVEPLGHGCLISPTDSKFMGQKESGALLMNYLNTQPRFE